MSESLFEFDDEEVKEGEEPKEVLGGFDDVVEFDDEEVKVVEEETNKTLNEIKTEKGLLRQVVMELLYRVSGLKGAEIGNIMGVGYTSVSQERRRLRERLQRNRKLRAFVSRLENRCNK